MFGGVWLFREVQGGAPIRDLGTYMRGCPAACAASSRARSVDCTDSGRGGVGPWDGVADGGVVIIGNA